MTRIQHYVTMRRQVLSLFVAVLSVSATASAQDLSAQDVQRTLRDRPTLLDEQGRPIERQLDPESYVPNEIIVRFQSGTLGLPQQQDRAAPVDIGARSTISALLAVNGVEEVRKVFRTFQPSDTLQALRSGGFVRVPDLSQVVVLRFSESKDIPTLIEQFEALPDVIYAEPNHLYKPAVEPPVEVDFGVMRSPILIAPNDTRYGNQWGLEQSTDEDIDAETAWNYDVGSSDVKIAVLDTGIDYNHPDLGSGFGASQKSQLGL